MISKLSQKITEILCRLQLIESEEQNLYFYGMFMVLSQTLFLIVALIFGLLFSSFWESFTFYVLFSSLRCYAGGIHASKENTCTLYTVVALFLSVVCIYAQKSINNSFFSFVVLVVGSVVVYLLCPLDTEDKPLTFTEVCQYKRKSRLIVVGSLLIAIIATFIHLEGILYAAATSLTLESILLLLGTLKNRT